MRHTNRLPGIEKLPVMVDDPVEQQPSEMLIALINLAKEMQSPGFELDPLSRKVYFYFPFGKNNTLRKIPEFCPKIRSDLFTALIKHIAFKCGESSEGRLNIQNKVFTASGTKYFSGLVASFSSTPNGNRVTVLLPAKAI